MSSAPNLLLLGISHRNASVQQRELVSVAPETIPSLLEGVRAIAGVQEAFLVSTCNRTEVLVVLDSDQDERRHAVINALHRMLFAPVDRDALNVYSGVEAIVHVFRVTAGLDSLVLGEAQILGQVREAHRLAKEVNSTGAWLEPLLQQASNVGKRVRTETAVGDGTLSVARAGVELAERVFGDFDECSVAIIGAGETGRLAARHFKAGGARKLTFFNRTRERADEAARELGFSAAPLEDLGRHIPSADVVVTCVANAPDLLLPDHVDVRALRNRDRPMVLIDLSVPRAIHPLITALSNALAYNLDDLGKIVDQNRGERQRAAEEAAPLLLAEVHKFLSLRTYASLSPSIAALRKRFEEAREIELDESSGGESSPEALRLAHRLTNRLLDVALDQMKRGARDSIPTESIDEAYQRFLDDA